MALILFDPDANFRDRLAADLREAGLAPQTVDDLDHLPGLTDDGEPCLLLFGLAADAQSDMAMLRHIVNVRGWRCLVFTADSAGEERSASLEMGAEDVVERTAMPREIIARIKAVLRRHVPPSGWRVATERRSLMRPDGTTVPLTTAEFDLFSRLAARPGEAASREELFSAVFGRGFNPLDRAIDTLVSKLRTKLGDTSPPTIIRTVRPVGYVFAGFGGKTPPFAMDAHAPARSAAPK